MWCLQMDREKAIKIFSEICDEVMNDPETWRIAEEMDLLYGRRSLTTEDLQQRFTI